MADSIQGKSARMENGHVSSCQSPGRPFQQCNGKKGAEYLAWVLKDVTMYRHKSFDLKNPAGATLTIGVVGDTMYKEQEKEVNGWGKFYLPDIVSMQVVGAVKGTSCPCDQLVLMTCEDEKLYAYDGEGEELHLVASNLQQLFKEGIEYPASKRYYDGEAFENMTEKDWKEVSEVSSSDSYSQLITNWWSRFLKLPNLS